MVSKTGEGGRFAKRMARMNRVGANRVQLLWAPYVPPWAVVVHRGRRTGKTYRTPVSAFVRSGRVAIALTYGTDTDWVRNVISGGGAELVRRGRTRPLRNPVIVARGDHAADLPRLVRRVAAHALVADLS